MAHYDDDPKTIVITDGDILVDHVPEPVIDDLLMKLANLFASRSIDTAYASRYRIYEDDLEIVDEVYVASDNVTTADGVEGVISGLDTATVNDIGDATINGTAINVDGDTVTALVANGTVTEHAVPVLSGKIAFWCECYDYGVREDVYYMTRKIPGITLDVGEWSDPI